MTELRLATRSSSLAKCQANLVGSSLAARRQGLNYELVEVANLPINHKDSFVKLVEEALLSEQADVAVHSAKDLPLGEREGLEIVAYLPRLSPLDVLVFAEPQRVNDSGLKIGTASPRRRVQLLNLGKDYRVAELRGNVTSRIHALGPSSSENSTAREFDAVILAAAGLIRLGMTALIGTYMHPVQLVPAAGQGAILLQARRFNRRIKELCGSLNDPQTQLCVTAERHCCAILGADCDSAVGAYAFISEQEFYIYAMAGDVFSNEQVMTCRRLPVTKWDLATAELCGKLAAEDLLAQGAGEFFYKTKHPQLLSAAPAAQPGPVH